MTTTAPDLRAVRDEALAQPTFPKAFQLTAAAYGDTPALRTHDDTTVLSWRDYADRVRAIAGALASVGVGRGDCVALLLTNRIEFHLVDTAALHLGATPFSVYHTNPPGQIAPLLANSDARVLVTEPAFLERARAAQALHPGLEHLVVVEGDGPEETFAAFAARPAPTGFDFDATWRAVEAEDVATIVYTSGTTGAPKGVQHPHRSIFHSLRGMQKLAPVTPGGRVVTYLPNAHIAERYISHYASMVFGYTITVCPDPKQLPAALVSTRPTRMFGVPRIFEKLAAGVQGMAASEPDGPLAAAIDAGLARVRAEQAGGAPPPLAPEAEKVLAGVRAKLGLDALEWVGVAAAPSPYSMLEFMHAIGVPLQELWGMSECIFSTSNPSDRIKLGTIGIAVPDVEIRLADDGEILVRGANLMSGYRKDPEKTAEAIDADGWLHTGDVAAADADGYLKIVDRKKELIINSAGKNMAPSKIELAVKAECDLIAQVVAIGDAKPYVTALIVLDPEACESAGYGSDPAVASALPEVRERVAEAIARGNDHLARVEQIKTHTILPVAWLPGSEEVTPTMKLRRRPIAERYAAEIAAMYA